MSNSARKVILAVTGASGSVYASRLMEKLGTLKGPPCEIAVVFSETAKEIWEFHKKHQTQILPLETD
jgi:4-hydroxy-3-polyprenylbenzoate decarboxylase